VTTTAALIQSLTFSGSMLSTGVPNASGTVNFYVPGGLVPQAVYADYAGTISVTQPVTLDNGGRIPVATYANGIYVTTPVRIIVKDVNGITVSDATLLAGGVATSVGLSNADWPSETTVDAAFTALGRSLGTSAAHGQDGNILITSGATGIPIRDYVAGIQINVKAFGAKGDGITDDTVACQAALTYMGTIGSGTLKFPAGTYKISSAALVLPNNLTGIQILGDGCGATIINQTTAATDVFDATGSINLILRGMNFAGGAVTLTTPSEFLIDACVISKGLIVSGTPSTSGPSVIAASYLSNVGGTNALTLSAYTQPVKAIGTTFQIASVGISMTGATYGVYLLSCEFQSATLTTGIKWGSGATGIAYGIDCLTLGSLTTPIDVTGISIDPGIVLTDCGIDNLTLSFATGTTQLVLSYYKSMTLNASSGGAGSVTVGAPTPTAGVSQGGKYFEIEFINGAGGAVTWTMNAAYVLTGAIDTTDTHKTIIGFRFDATALKWRERYRAQTT
jgi:hypothetical protein